MKFNQTLKRSQFKLLTLTAYRDDDTASDAIEAVDGSRDACPPPRGPSDDFMTGAYSSPTATTYWRRTFIYE
jgi:hypothetical protein